MLLAAYDEGDSDDDGPAVYCSTHKDKVISRREFISPVTKDPVKYSGKFIFGPSLRTRLS